jgi:N-methylhydantoinase A
MRAVKAVTTYRGRDPRDFSLFAFGGNGGVHAAGLARVLQVSNILVPRAAGVFSAIGLLCSEFKMDETAPFHYPVMDSPLDRAEHVFTALEDRIASMLGERLLIRFEHFADARFTGQAFELTIPFPGPLDRVGLTRLCADFAAEHTRRYGHSFSGRFPVEIVNLRVIGTRPPDASASPLASAPRDLGTTATRLAYFGPILATQEVEVIGRASLGVDLRKGPCIIEEYEGTTVVPPNATARLGPSGTVTISLVGEPRPDEEVP